MRTGDPEEKSELARRRPEAMSMAVADALAAVKMVRTRAGEWGVKPDRVGIMGFSAGGYATVGVALQGTGDSRPDFAAPIYAYTQDITAPSNPPPMFIAHADDDRGVPPIKHSMRLYTAYKAVGGSIEMHIYSKGGHGFGMLKKGFPSDAWIERFGEWMKAQGLAP
jgi:acetyl esterase/lipase